MKENTIQIELVSSQVELVRAALMLRTREVPPISSQAYARLARQMKPVGLYQFTPMEAINACLALHDFYYISEQIGMESLASQAESLAKDFLAQCERTNLLKHESQPERSTGLLSRLSSIIRWPVTRRPAPGYSGATSHHIMGGIQDEGI